MKSFGLFPLTEGFSNNYRNDFDPRITNAFATAGFRMGHSLIPEMIKYKPKIINSNIRKIEIMHVSYIYYSRAFSSRGRQTRNLDLKDAFGNMDIVEQRSMLDGLLRGMLKQRLQKADKKVWYQREKYCPPSHRGFTNGRVNQEGAVSSANCRSVCFILQRVLYRTERFHWRSVCQRTIPRLLFHGCGQN